MEDVYNIHFAPLTKSLNASLSHTTQVHTHLQQAVPDILHDVDVALRVDILPQGYPVPV